VHHYPCLILSLDHTNENTGKSLRHQDQPAGSTVGGCQRKSQNEASDQEDTVGHLQEDVRKTGITDNYQDTRTDSDHITEKYIVAQFSESRRN